MEEMEDVRMKQMRSDWENDLATKKRLSFMSTDASAFKDKLKVSLLLQDENLTYF